MDQEKMTQASAEAQAEGAATESQLSAEAVAAAMHSVSPGSRQFFMGFLSGMQAAEEVKKAG